MRKLYEERDRRHRGVLDRPSRGLNPRHGRKYA
jgi:hypothetical protein